MTGALAGTRVLDITNFFAGPHACMMLADMGADVIKIEQPPRGDPTRNREDDSGYAASFVAKNRNKPSVRRRVSTSLTTASSSPPPARAGSAGSASWKAA